jgi:hypothetical protein
MPLVQPIIWIGPRTTAPVQEQILRHVKNAEEYVKSLKTGQWQGSTQDIPPELQIEQGSAWSASRVDTWEGFLQDNLPVPVELVVKTEGKSLACSCKLASEGSETAVEHSSTCTCACNFCSKQRLCACTTSTCVCSVLCNCSCAKCKHVVVSHIPRLSEMRTLTSRLESRCFTSDSRAATLHFGFDKGACSAETEGAQASSAAHGSIANLRGSDAACTKSLLHGWLRKAGRGVEGPVCGMSSEGGKGLAGPDQRRCRRS